MAGNKTIDFSTLIADRTRNFTGCDCVLHRRDLQSMAVAMISTTFRMHGQDSNRSLPRL